MSVNMRLSGNTDCHTSDIGHWFAMTKTDFVYGLKRPAGGGAFPYDSRVFSVPAFSLIIAHACSVSSQSGSRKARVGLTYR